MTKKLTHKRGTKVRVKSFEGTLVEAPKNGYSRVSVRLGSGRGYTFWTAIPEEFLEYVDE